MTEPILELEYEKYERKLEQTIKEMRPLMAQEIRQELQQEIRQELQQEIRQELAKIQEEHLRDKELISSLQLQLANFQGQQPSA